MYVLDEREGVLYDNVVGRNGVFKDKAPRVERRRCAREGWGTSGGETVEA